MKTIAKLYKNNFYFPITVILFGLLIFGIPKTWAQDLGASEDAVDTLYMDEVNMVLGELTQLKVYSLTRLSMTDPEIADILDASDGEVLLIAKNIGQTPLFISAHTPAFMQALSLLSCYLQTCASAALCRH